LLFDPRGRRLTHFDINQDPGLLAEFGSNPNDRVGGLSSEFDI
jgi:hypothetical protein